jgi:molecular chaperone HscB
MPSELTRNHFEVFGLPVQLAIDQQRLSERYRELQRTVHPDRYVNATDQERRLSLQRAAQINEAYRTLRDPLARARYLLALRGADVDDERDTSMEPAFLIEQMELRESLEALRSAQDPQETLTAMMGTIDSRIAAITEKLQGQLADGSESGLAAARVAVRKLQFLHRLREEALAREAELEDELG